MRSENFSKKHWFFLKILNPLNTKASTDGAEIYGTYRTCVGINMQKQISSNGCCFVEILGCSKSLLVNFHWFDSAFSKIAIKNERLNIFWISLRQNASNTLFYHIYENEPNWSISIEHIRSWLRWNASYQWFFFISKILLDPSIRFSIKSWP